MKSFLEPLNFRRRTGALLKEQGFDDPDDFGNMSASDVDTMAAALSAGGMKPGVPGVDVPGSTSRGRDSFGLPVAPVRDIHYDV